MTDIDDNGLLTTEQDLSTLSPGLDDHNRMYNHDGSSSITLTDGSTTSGAGLYLWDKNAAAWDPVSASGSITDTRVNFTDGTTTVNAPTDATFSASGAASVDVVDNGDGTTTVTISATDTDTDTHTDVSENGVAIVSDVGDINFSSNLNVTNDGDGTVTVDAQTSAADTLNPFPNHHSKYEGSLTNEEIHRMTLPTGVAMEIHELNPQLKGGGTDANVTVDVYDATNATVLASTTAGTPTRGSPISTSATEATVLLRISTGSTSVKLSISGKVREV